MSRIVTGSDLVPGMAIRNAVIVRVEPYQVPAAILHDSLAAKHPNGLPGRLVYTEPSRYGFTAFDSDDYEVLS